MFFEFVVPRPPTMFESIEAVGVSKSKPLCAVSVSERSLGELLIFSDAPLAEHKESPQLTP